MKFRISTLVFIGLCSMAANMERLDDTTETTTTPGPVDSAVKLEQITSTTAGDLVHVLTTLTKMDVALLMTSIQTTEEPTTVASVDSPTTFLTVVPALRTATSPASENPEDVKSNTKVFFIKNADRVALAVTFLVIISILCIAGSVKCLKDNTTPRAHDEEYGRSALIHTDDTQDANSTQPKLDVSLERENAEQITHLEEGLVIDKSQKNELEAEQEPVEGTNTEMVPMASLVFMAAELMNRMTCFNIWTQARLWKAEFDRIFVRNFELNTTTGEGTSQSRGMKAITNIPDDKAAEQKIEELKQATIESLASRYMDIKKAVTIKAQALEGKAEFDKTFDEEFKLKMKTDVQAHLVETANTAHQEKAGQPEFQAQEHDARETEVDAFKFDKDAKADELSTRKETSTIQEESGAITRIITVVEINATEDDLKDDA